jgi:hypothetical protein
MLLASLPDRSGDTVWTGLGDERSLRTGIRPTGVVATGIVATGVAGGGCRRGLPAGATECFGHAQNLGTWPGTLPPRLEPGATNT